MIPFVLANSKESYEFRYVVVRFGSVFWEDTSGELDWYTRMYIESLAGIAMNNSQLNVAGRFSIFED